MLDQAQQLRRQIEQAAPPDRRTAEVRTPIITVTSGKGGVGKTSIAVNLATALASFPLDVFLADADVGFNGFDATLRIDGAGNREEDYPGADSIRKGLLRGPLGMKILPAPAEDPFVAESDGVYRENLVRRLKIIAESVDAAVIDTPGGAGRWNIEFSRMADLVLLVTACDPASVADTAGLLRFLLRRIEPEQLRLVANMVSTEEDLDRIEKLSLETGGETPSGDCIGFAPFIRKDPAVELAIKQREIFLLEYPGCDASGDILLLADYAARSLELVTPAYREGV